MLHFIFIFSTRTIILGTECEVRAKQQNHVLLSVSSHFSMFVTHSLNVEKRQWTLEKMSLLREVGRSFDEECDVERHLAISENANSDTNEQVAPRTIWAVSVCFVCV